MAANVTACWPEPQKRLRVTPGASVSQPASSAAMRAMSIEWSPRPGAAAHHHVVDLLGVELGAVLQRVQHLGEDALRVDRVQRPGLLAGATGGADGVDDERFTGVRHGDLQVAGWLWF